MTAIGKSVTDVVTLLAPLSGIMIPLSDVPDAVFAQRMTGDGVSIDPLSNHVLAPCDGRVVQIHRAAHALTLESNGLEILIHVGIDTVMLKGDGFTAMVKAGDVVRAGDPLLSFDIDRVGRKAKSLLTQVLVTNMDRVASIELGTGRVKAARDVIMTVRLAGGASTAPAAVQGEAVTSAPIVVAAETGLHARPAALLASTARRFTSDVRLMNGDREANVRSVVSIMALEVGGGDRVFVVARGDDAQEAVAAISALLVTKMDTPGAPSSPRTHGAFVPPTAASAVNDGAYHGVSASPGVAVGRVVQLRHDDDVVSDERALDPNQERRSLDAAIAAAHLQLEALRTHLSAQTDADRAAIFSAHQELLEDPEVLDRAAEEIRGGATAAFAWKQAYVAQANRLLALKSELLAGRATDMRDVGRRVLHLLTGRESNTQALPPDSIIVAEDLIPSETASLDRTKVRGFCTTMGSSTSHVAILARGLGIPAVAGIDPRVLDIAAGTLVVLDGDAGLLRVNPDAKDQASIAERQAASQRRQGEALAAAHTSATTRDGHRVEVAANVGSLEEAERVTAAGGEGIGLLRTEFIFMHRRAMPTEDDQAEIYASIVKAVGPDHLTVIRTLDVGGDKPLPYLPMAAEANPFLGERGVRMTLARPELFRAQVRAILRASRSGRVAIMFPMVATMAEWRASRELVESERADLGLAPIQIGIMVETAAAALLADHFARDADFFSIGTNDLTQYTLAMDRTNPRLASQVDALHPAVLRLIERTVAGAHAHNRWVGVCGALAGDPQAVPVLVGLGVDELSTDIPIVSSVKARVRELSFAECKLTAEQALNAGDGAEVRALVASRHPAEKGR